VSSSLYISTSKVEHYTGSYLLGDLAKGAVLHGNKALTEERPKLNLAFRVSRVSRRVKSLSRPERVMSRNAKIYLAAVLEYVTGKILTLAGNVAGEFDKESIGTQHIHRAMLADAELAPLLFTIR
jgi:hypothetical protein